MKELLKVTQLKVCTEKKYFLAKEKKFKEKDILKNFSLKINEGETHVIMGPNGSGKSTFSKFLAGHPDYKIQSGQISFLGEDFSHLSPEERSHKGLFLAFQYPVEIAGVTTYDFLRLAYNEKQKALGKDEVDPIEFLTKIQSSLTKVNLNQDFLNRNLNESFSGGEKKRNEILQMILLEPKLVILDEIDSGLDIDALKLICQTIKENLPKNAGLLIITHYPKILEYLNPNFVHLMRDGKIIKTGSSEIVDFIEKEGYDFL